MAEDIKLKSIPKLPLATNESLDGNEFIAISQNGLTKKVLGKNYLNSIASEFDYIQFNTSPPEITTRGTILWNESEYTLDINTGLGATIQVGQEMVLLYYNDTGSDIPNGTVLHPKGAITMGDVVIPTPELADASDQAKSEGTLTVSTHVITNGTLGFATRFGKVRGVDTSGFTPGQTLWLSATQPGELTATRPSFPNYAISIGGSLNSDINGDVFVTITKSVEDTFNDGWDGAIRETFDFKTDSNGTVITGTLTNVDTAKDLTLLFSDVGFYRFDTTPAATITLTPGTDTTPVLNYVYIPIDTKVLTVNTSGFPLTEHCKIAELLIESAATTQLNGGTLRNQNINDHIKKEDDNGHILHMSERLRSLNADWKNGTEATLTGTPTNSYINVTGGKVWQLHLQDFPAISMPTDFIRIVNDFTTTYRRTNNLNTITAYSDGSVWNNEWGSIVIWGVANQSGEPSFIMCNLPSNGYSSEANAVADGLNYNNYSIPKEYKGVGFLIARFTVKNTGGSFTYNPSVGYKDLRGFIPNNITGGVGGGGGGVTSLLALDDVFINSYAGKYGQLAMVNESETGVVSSDVIPGEKTFKNTGDTYVSIDSDSDNAGLKFKKGGVEKFVWVIERNTPIFGQSPNDLILYNSSLGAIAAIFRVSDSGFILATPSDGANDNKILTRDASNGIVKKIDIPAGGLAGLTALNLKAPIDSPTFTGDVEAPTPATSSNSNRVATTAFVKNQGYITGFTNNYVSSISFNTSTGVLTLNRNGLSALTQDLDGRYVTSSGVTSIATSGSISGGTITASGTITHLTTAGHKHIPSGGATGQFLKYSASGTASWSTPQPNDITDSFGTITPSGGVFTQARTNENANITISSSNKTLNVSNPVNGDFGCVHVTVGTGFSGSMVFQIGGSATNVRVESGAKSISTYTTGEQYMITWAYQGTYLMVNMAKYE
jgi:hypothetical protein